MQPAGPLFRGTLAAVSLVATGLRAAYRVPDGTVDFRVELDQLPLATGDLGATQQALAEANPGGAPWAELRQIVLERADKRAVDIAVLEAPTVPAELEPMLKRRLDLATVPEVELAADFFERTKSRPTARSCSRSERSGWQPRSSGPRRRSLRAGRTSSPRSPGGTKPCRSRFS